MQIENVARVCLTSGRTVKQQRECTVSHGMLGQIIINDQNILALMHEELADGAARIGGNILKGRGFGRGCGHDDGIIHRAVRSQGFSHLCNGRTLLADRYVDTDDARTLLIDDGVQANLGLAGLAVADDQLTLAAADRDHRVNRLDTGLKRYVNRGALDDTGGRHLNRARFVCLNGALAVDRLPERVYDAAEHRFTDWDLYNTLGSLDRIAFADILVGTEDNGADQILLKVLGHTVYAAGELQQFARHALL